MNLYLATKRGFVKAVQSENGWEVAHRGLDGRHLTSLIAREGVILAGTRDGIVRSDDDGHSWRETSQGLTQRHVRRLAYHPDVSDREFAGTEPAAIFTSADGGASWQACDEVAALRDRFDWWLPYSDGAGCVRGFAFHGQRGYAAVEVGGLLRSDDGGASWALAPGSDGRSRFGSPPDEYIHPDVHSVAVHPTSPDLVLAPTGGGFYRSQDGGETWTALYGDCYARAVWVDGNDPNHMILGPAEGAHGRNGRIEETEDGGRQWRRTAGPWDGDLVERFTQVGDTLFAVMANGGLRQRRDGAWQTILAEVGGVQAATGMG